jgi:hypothetical protein
MMRLLTVAILAAHLLTQIMAFGGFSDADGSLYSWTDIWHCAEVIAKLLELSVNSYDNQEVSTPFNRQHCAVTKGALKTVLRINADGFGPKIAFPVSCI